ncbi:MAG TPA: ABC transporter substrate-binding protein [Candidatus Binatia bacterium]|jgi:NitT/TauT family transport system substrate-binding protein|nr:ABC transporter substrate-binding protein [Candidatus Binatia bacterium]
MKATFLFFVALIFYSSALHAADKMTVAYATLGPGLSPGWITADKGIWRKHGLDVELVYLGGGSRSVPALLSGSIQLFMGSDTAAYVAAIQGAKIVKIGVTMNTLGYFLMTTPEIRSIADLKGKVLGISLGRDLPYAHLTKILRDHGIDPKADVKFLPLGGGPGGYISALKAGRVQASMLIPPNHLVAEKAGLKVLTKIDVPTLAGGLNTSQLILEKNRDTFIRFLKGYLEGIQFMVKNKHESLKIFAKYLQNSDPAVNGYLYDDITSRIERDLRPTIEAIRYMLDLIVLDLPQAQRVSDKDFWDLSLLDEIKKSGFVDQVQKN